MAKTNRGPSDGQNKCTRSQDNKRLPAQPGSLISSQMRGQADREAKRQKRELERQAREQAKFSAQEQALFEVRTYENQLEVLLSVHKEQGPVWDWLAVASALPPPLPQPVGLRELKVQQELCFLSSGRADPGPAILQAKHQDEQEFERAVQVRTVAAENVARLRTLAWRVLEGDLKAFTGALVELSPLGELSELGTSIHFTVHNQDILQAELTVKGTAAIPSQVKSLTTTGKLSVKAMPRAKFHELYQDYICSCILRVAREVFALLPIEMVLVTASVVESDDAGEQPVLSVAIPRSRVNGLDFERLDPSDTIETFTHRGDFKASRKTGAFAPILPITVEEVRGASVNPVNSEELLAKVYKMTEEIRNLRARLEAQCPPLSK